MHMILSTSLTLLLAASGTCGLERLMERFGRHEPAEWAQPETSTEPPGAADAGDTETST